MKGQASALVARSFAAPGTIGDEHRVLPVQAIEIDRCFMADLQVRPKCTTFVLTIVASPSALCLHTISKAPKRQNKYLRSASKDMR